MKVWSLQSLRFFAALAVVLFHAAGAIDLYGHRVGVLGLEGASFGRAGVDVFFVLSGVIIAMTCKGLTAKAFIAKRATRILPLYGVMLVPYLLAGIVRGTVGWREWVASLTFWPAFDRIVPPVVPIAWTLCFEVLFYAATALVIWRPRLAWLLAAIFLAALATRAGPVTQFVGNPLILEFLLGVGLTRLPRTRYAILGIPVGLAVAWFLGGQGYPMTTGMFEGAMAWNRLLYFGVPAALVVWGAMQLSVRPGLLSYLGDASYALYLAHPPVVLSLVWLLCRYTSLPADVMALIAAAASILVAWRVHELVEKPLIAWLRNPSFRSRLMLQA